MMYETMIYDNIFYYGLRIMETNIHLYSYKWVNMEVLHIFLSHSLSLYVYIYTYLYYKSTYISTLL